MKQKLQVQNVNHIKNILETSPLYLEAKEKRDQLRELQPIGYCISIPISLFFGPVISFIIWELIKGLGIFTHGIGTVSSAMAAGVTTSGKNKLIEFWNTIVPSPLSFHAMRGDAIEATREVAKYTNDLIDAALTLEIKMAILFIGVIATACTSIACIEYMNKKRRKERRVIVTHFSRAMKSTVKNKEKASPLYLEGV